MKVLVACFDNWNTLAEIPYILKKSGFEVDILSGKDAWVKKNKFYNQWIPAKSESDDYLQQLKELAQNSKYEWIIPGDEKLIKLLNEEITDEGLFYKLLPLTRIENREMLCSKIGFSNICTQNNILTPGYCYYPAADNNSNIDTLRFPVIIKVDFSWGGLGIRVCENKPELEKIIAGLPEHETIIIQEFIRGKEVPVEALFWKGKLLSVTSSEILDYDKDEFSYSTRRRYFPADEKLRQAVKEFGERVGVHGFVNMAYIKADANGSYYVIEADLRPSSWMAYTGYAGSSFIHALRTITFPEKRVVTQTPKEVEIALFHKDLRRGFYKHDIRGLSRWVYNIKYWKYIPFYDHKLLSYTFSQLWREFFIEKMQRTFKLRQS